MKVELKQLPYDVARCSPTEKPCPNKCNCARYTSGGRPDGRQTMMDMSTDVGLGDLLQCPLFIDNAGGSL